MIGQRTTGSPNALYTHTLAHTHTHTHTLWHTLTRLFQPGEYSQRTKYTTQPRSGTRSGAVDTRGSIDWFPSHLGCGERVVWYADHMILTPGSEVTRSQGGSALGHSVRG